MYIPSHHVRDNLPLFLFLLSFCLLSSPVCSVVADRASAASAETGQQAEIERYTAGDTPTADEILKMLRMLGGASGTVRTLSTLCMYAYVVRTTAKSCP